MSASPYLVEIGNWGAALHRAFVTRTPIEPITASVPDLSVNDAYAIQLDFINRRTAEESSRIVGRKIGVTSKVVQEMLHVHQPDFGHLLSTMAREEGSVIDIEELIEPRAEGEIAFLLKQDLRGPGITPADVLRATECVMPCLEIVDSRVKDWKISIQDTVADNASSGLFVIGGAIADPYELDLALVGMTFRKNGEIVGTGAGAAALGHPLNSVTWIANTLGRLGVEMKAGEVILSGALSALIPIRPGDSLTVSLGGIGSASARFSEGSEHA